MITVIGIALLDVAIVFGAPHYPPKIDHADAIIIMGAAINTPALTNRTLEGLRLYEEGKAPVMILSGGRISDADISEAQFMEKVINKNSDQPVNMILEQSSHSTYENIINSKEKVPDATSVIVVSDEFHLARAALTARTNGFSKVYWSYPEPTYYSKGELRRYYLRELAAMISYVPKFLKN
jgi:uncharacterized SAM-binding protein YcdF (DUF218 family)